MKRLFFLLLPAMKRFFNYRLPTMKRSSLYFIPFLLLTAALAQAQVSVAPVALFLGDEQPFGTFYVSNQSETPQEVDISFRFGYPTSDDDGDVFMEWNDSLAAETYSIASYVSAFPSQFMLGPGESQVIRLLARAPDELEDRTYWTRLVTTSTPQQSFVNSTNVEGVSARVVFRLQQVTSVLYEHGDTQLDVSIGGVRVRQEDDELVILTSIDREGSAPFLGTAKIRIENQEGALITTAEEGFAAYFDMVKRMRIPLSDIESGTYRITVTVTPERPDIPPARRSTVDPVSQRVTYQIE